MSGTANGAGQTVVDISGLAQLADELRQFTGQAIQGESQTARGTFSAGVPFGEASASGDVYVAKQRYHENLVRVIDTLDAYVAEGEFLAAKAREASGNYADTDAAAAARTNGVGPALAGFGTPAFIGPVAPTVPAGFIGPVAPATPAVGPDGSTGDTPGFTEVNGWCTNWNAYDAPALWQMVEPDNICEGWTQVLAWQRVAVRPDCGLRSTGSERKRFRRGPSLELRGRRARQLPLIVRSIYLKRGLRTIIFMV